MSGDFYVISDEPGSWTLQDELDRMAKADEKEKKALQELKKQDKHIDRSEQFIDAHWICPRSGDYYSREDTVGINHHKLWCNYCFNKENAAALARKEQLEGGSDMRTALSFYESTKRILEENKGKATFEEPGSIKFFTIEGVRKTNQRAKDEIYRLLTSKDVHPSRQQSATHFFEEEWKKMTPEKRRKEFGRLTTEWMSSHRPYYWQP
jgi:hypothetical protein